MVMALSEQLQAAGDSIVTISVPKMQQELLQALRLEFNHNLSQQIYVSDETWTQIINARDEMAAFIASVAGQLPQGATALDYSNALITAYANNGDTPHQLALDALKTEARGIL